MPPAVRPVDVPRPSAVAPVPLSRLMAAGATRDGDDVVVTGATAASELVRPGDLFAALPGRTVHGARFAAAAVHAGAAAVLTDRAGRDQVPAGVPVLVVDDPRDALGPVAATIYGEPSRALRVLGVTGTSGKTTTTYLVQAGLRAAGRTPGLIGTVATHIGDELLKSGFTTPEAPELQAVLAVMRERGVTDVAMEVSSHALALGRVGGTWFAAAGFTNLSEDHLDLHGSMAEYFAAKAQLFTPRYTRRRVIVVDDEYGRALAETTPDASTVATDVTGTPGSAATWRADDVTERADGTTTFQVHGPGVRLQAGCAIPGRYNVANALLALALLHEVGVPVEQVAEAVAQARVPGRMERVEAGQAFLAVVDYSHKPAAVAGALRALRPLTHGRLIIVLGCGGDRDRGKRPHMGEIAARGADLLIVTDDNPRSEDPGAIRSAVLDGARALPAGERGEVLEIGDRAAAIAHAVSVAGPGDCVLVAGKGHEPGQEIGGTVYPFDDRDVLRAALRARS